jgi:hypothetical protein
MLLPLFGPLVHAELTRCQHGGAIRQRRRKLARPVSTRRPMHLTLSSQRARGPWSLRRHERAVAEVLRASARRHNVRVYEFANVGSHLHLLVRARRREDFQAFLRSFAGLVARRVTGSRRGRPLEGGPFWSALAWSRLVAWGRDYMGVRHYIFRNRIEATDGSAVRRALELGAELVFRSLERKEEDGPRAGRRLPPDRV